MLMTAAAKADHLPIFALCCISHVWPEVREVTLLGLHAAEQQLATASLRRALALPARSLAWQLQYPPCSKLGGGALRATGCSECMDKCACNVGDAVDARIDAVRNFKFDACITLTISSIAKRSH